MLPRAGGHRGGPRAGLEYRPAARRGLAGPGGPAQTLLDTVAEEAARQGQGYQLAFAGYARCILELGRGRYDQAHASLTGGIDDSSQIKFALPDLVEAAERSGHHAAAHHLTSQLAALAEASPVPRTLGFLARAQALTARDAPDAEPHYQAAIAHHSQTRGTRAPGPQPPRLRRVAAPRPAAAGRPRAAAHGLPSLRRDGCAGLRGPGPAGAVGGRRDRGLGGRRG